MAFYKGHDPANDDLSAPTNSDEINRLPTVLAFRLVPYLATFRGRPDPTPAA